MASCGWGRCEWPAADGAGADGQVRMGPSITGRPRKKQIVPKRMERARRKQVRSIRKKENAEGGTRTPMG